MEERGAARPAAAGRLTLGLVTANIHLGVGATLWSGVLAAAERNDVHLVCFPGGPLRPGGARASVYELIGAARLDGVICWTSTLGLPAAGERAERLVRRLGELPVVSLNRALGEHETLRLDSRAGMREAVGHLVGDHGRRRPACLRGPLANPVSLERYRAYTEALARHRIPHDRSLVAASADFGSGAGASAMRVLLDVRGLRPGRDFDAVVACSDVLAADALRHLTGRGIRVPEDVAVVSFNDSMEARLSDPPLTSVALPFAELGALAVDTLVARLRGDRPPARAAVAGTLVTRRSCGCHSPLVTQGGGEGPAGEEGSGAGSPGARERGAWERGAPRERAPEPGVLGEVFGALSRSGGELADAFLADLGGGGDGRDGDGGDGNGGGRTGDGVPGGTFLPLLERLVVGRVRSFEDAAAWDRALLRVRSLAAPRLPDSGRARAERLLGQARLMVADKSHRLLEYERWAEEQESRRLRDLGTTLTTAVDLDALTGALARHLPGTGITGCRLLLREDDGRLPRGLPDELSGPLASGGRRTLVLEPLHIGEEQLGYALFDTGPGDGRGATRRGALYRALGDQISAALKGIRLFDEVRRARDAAEQANRLKTRLLDNATDELRTPVEAILRHTARPAAGEGRPGEQQEGERQADGSAEALRLAHDDAARLLRLIDDLLDLSRSEIDDLDLSRRLLDPRPVLVEAFHAAAGDAPGARLDLPRRLPAVRADAPRLRQILLNLLAAAAERPGTAGSDGDGGGALLLTAEVHPAHLRVRVLRPGLALPPGEDEHLFQPFASGAPGMRLGLAIARRLAVLHGGSVTLDRDPRPRGFRLDLPLPTPAELPAPAEPSALPDDRGRALLVAAAPAPPPEIAALARRHGLTPRRLRPDDDIAALVAEHPPAAVAWDTAAGGPPEWSAVQRLHDHPALRRTPFLLYGPVAGDGLAQALRALRPAGLADPVVIVDGSASARERLGRLVSEVLPGRAVRTAADGTTALSLLRQEAPCLLVAARLLPDMDGFDVAERMYESAGHSGLPVLMLSDRGFTFDDVRRAEPYPGLVLLGRDILTDEETAALLRTLTARAEPGPHRSSAPVRHALAYMEQHYRHRLSRWQVAQAAGVSEDHLSRLFHREFGLPLWEYLTRLRIQRAKERLRHSDDSVQAVARAVGFHDRAYFSRVFRRVTGVAPHAYRETHAVSPPGAPWGAHAG